MSLWLDTARLPCPIKKPRQISRAHCCKLRSLIRLMTLSSSWSYYFFSRFPRRRKWKGRRSQRSAHRQKSSLRIPFGGKSGTTDQFLILQSRYSWYLASCSLADSVSKLSCALLLIYISLTCKPYLVCRRCRHHVVGYGVQLLPGGRSITANGSLQHLQYVDQKKQSLLSFHQVGCRERKPTVESIMRCCFWFSCNQYEKSGCKEFIQNCAAWQITIFPPSRDNCCPAIVFAGSREWIPAFINSFGTVK